VTFKAGLELWWFQLSFSSMAAVTRACAAVGVPAPRWTALARPLKAISEWPWVWALGTNQGGMQVACPCACSRLPVQLNLGCAPRLDRFQCVVVSLL
jgi:hypothetical protein